MPSLRLLRLVTQKSEFCLPNNLPPFHDKLRYLEWNFFPLKSLGLPKGLVYLCMPFSQLEKLWNDVKVHYMLLYKFFDYVDFEYDFSIKGHIN